MADTAVKRQTVKLPDTFKASKATVPFPPRAGRIPSATYLALKGIVEGLEFETPMTVPADDEVAQQAIARHLRRAAQECGVGIRVGFIPGMVMFQTQPKRARKSNKDS